MRYNLKVVFKERIDNNNEYNFKLSTISLFNIRRILRIYMDSTRRK